MLAGWCTILAGGAPEGGDRKRFGDLTHTMRETAGRNVFAGLRAKMAAALMALFAVMTLAAPAAAETRSLKIKFVHTGEQAEIVFKRNGRYDRDGLNKLNRLLRDFRRNEPTKMDARLFDLAWAIYRQTGSRDYIHVLSGYRSPATNAWLKRTRGGQAEKSQHIQGKAMDFYIPGVSVKRIREIAMKQQGGGVGYYPRSGSPFVHIDVARVRAWPRMSRQELVRLFPDGKTLHLPPDGKPLPGYEAALASYQSRQKSGDIAIASGGGGKKASGILASLFGDDTEEEEEVGNIKAAPKPAAARAPEPQVAEAKPEPQPVAAKANRPSVREMIVAALPGRDPAEPLAAPRPDAEVGGGIQDVVGAPAANQPAPRGEAANVPVPTRRPAYKPAVETLVASLGDAGTPVPSQRPDSDVTLAALTPAETVSAKASVNEGSAKGGRVNAGSIAKVASPAPKPVAKVTDKSPRPSAADAAPAPKPAVRPVAKKDVQVALVEPKPEILPNVKKSKTFAAQAVEKPSAVYMSGFSADIKAVDINRFSGKAVEFQSIAKFRKAE